MVARRRDAVRDTASTWEDLVNDMSGVPRRCWCSEFGDASNKNKEPPLHRAALGFSLLRPGRLGLVPLGAAVLAFANLGLAIARVAVNSTKLDPMNEVLAARCELQVADANNIFVPSVQNTAIAYGDNDYHAGSTMTIMAWADSTGFGSKAVRIRKVARIVDAPAY